MIKQKGPASGANRRPGENRGTRTTYHSLPSADNLEDSFAARVRQAEARLLACAFRDPVQFNDLAVDRGLSGGIFAFDLHSVMFTFLCLCVENNITPTVHFLLKAARDAGIPIDKLAVWDGVLFGPEYRADALALYVDEVADLARRRQEAADLQRQMQKLMQMETAPAAEASPGPRPQLKGVVIA